MEHVSDQGKKCREPAMRFSCMKKTLASALLHMHVMCVYLLTSLLSLALSGSRHSDTQPLLQGPRTVLGSVCGGSGSWSVWAGHLCGAGWGQRAGTTHCSDIGLYSTSLKYILNNTNI